jgi:hypothetical protein
MFPAGLLPETSFLCLLRVEKEETVPQGRSISCKFAVFLAGKGCLARNSCDSAGISGVFPKSGGSGR